MSDLVQRLRKPFDGGDYSILTEAATEIERLRAALKRLVEDIDAGFPRDEGYDTATELLNQQRTPQPDIDVRCACGWKGKQSQLDEEKRCPECTAIFNQFPRR